MLWILNYLSRKINHTPVLAIKIADKALGVVNAYKYLSIWITSSLNWKKCVEEVCEKLTGK